MIARLSTIALAVVLGIFVLSATAPEVRAQAEVHVVQAGETLFNIAQRYGMTVSELRALNNLSGDTIQVGQRLRLRDSGARPIDVRGPDEEDEIDYARLRTPPGVRPPDLVEPEPIPTGPPPPPPPPATINRIEIGQDGVQPLPTDALRAVTREGGEGGIHTVRMGETLFAIARSYGTTVGAIQRANDLRDDRLSVGQQLVVPGAAAAVGAPPVTTFQPGRYDVRRSTLPSDMVHLVVPGESLFSIAARYGTTAGRLLAFNTVDTGPLVPGTLLVLPDGVGRLYHREPAPPVVDAEGLALVYPASYVGRTTISGEDYDPRQLTASHRELPFGSMLRVIEPESGRQTLVRVNDRGPVSEGFLIELSQAAADALGLRSGSAHAVQVQVLR